MDRTDGEENPLEIAADQSLLGMSKDAALPARPGPTRPADCIGARVRRV